MKAPQIRIKPPGPKAREVIERDHLYSSPCYGRVYPLVVKTASGPAVEDVDGNLFLDFMAGIAVASTGHSHPKVVKAIEEQAHKFLHICGSDFYYEPMVELIDNLSRMAPGSSPKKVFLTNSGTEAVEAALKLARYATKRSHIIAFLGAFHGRTLGALSLTASRSAQRSYFAPLVPDIHHVPYGSSGIDAIRYIETVLFRRLVAPEEIAAIVVEPILGEGGYIVPAPEFLPMLQDLCRRHGMLLVVDEIQSGFGRTGKMFACDHWGIEPDILCVAKGIASGMPLGAMIARSEISTWRRSAHGSTFGGNPVACAAAVATLELIRDGLVENAAVVGSYLKEKLTALQSAHKAISDVRGLGLMIGVELARQDENRTPDPQLRDETMRRCFEQGLLLLNCGESTLRFCPPLIVGRAEVDVAIEIFDTVLADLRS